jgi:ADP-ribose pyrophosphatase YjhB (NUDIX family)
MPLGAAVLVRDEAGRILLVRQTYQRPAIWLPPGGWVDRGETPQQAACREAREEVGLNVVVGRPLSARGGGYGELTILFACETVGETTLRLSDEIEEARFFPVDALPLQSDGVRLWLEEALAALA